MKSELLKGIKRLIEINSKNVYVGDMMIGIKIQDHDSGVSRFLEGYSGYGLFEHLTSSELEYVESELWRIYHASSYKDRLDSRIELECLVKELVIKEEDKV